MVKLKNCLAELKVVLARHYQLAAHLQSVYLLRGIAVVCVDRALRAHQSTPVNLNLSPHFLNHYLQTILLQIVEYCMHLFVS